MISRIFNFKSITSTNDFAKEKLKEYDEVIVTAKFQTKGRGRKGRTWVGDFADNLYFTYGINHKKKMSSELCSLMQGYGSLVAKKAIEDVTGSKEIMLKYPNDIVITHDGFMKKIAGILVEHTYLGNNCSSSVIGFGINVNQTVYPEELANKAISLKLLGYDVNTAEVMENLIFQIDNTKLDEEEIYINWQQELKIIGKSISPINENMKYRVVKLLRDGRLATESLEDGSKRIFDDGESFGYEI